MLMHNAVLLKMVIFGQGQRQYVDTVDTWSGRFSDIAFRLCATRARFTVAVRVLGAFWSGGGPGKVPETRETHRPFTPFNGAETDVKSKRPACMHALPAASSVLRPERVLFGAVTKAETGRGCRETTFSARLWGCTAGFRLCFTGKQTADWSVAEV